MLWLGLMLLLPEDFLEQGWENRQGMKMSLTH